MWPFPDVPFNYARHNISDAYAGELTQQAEYLLSNPSVLIRITGYSNINALAFKRAQAVRDYLVREGIESFRMVLETKSGDELLARVAFLQ